MLKNRLKNYCASILASQSLSLLSFEVSDVTCWGGCGIANVTSESVGGSGIGRASVAMGSDSKTTLLLINHLT